MTASGNASLNCRLFLRIGRLGASAQATHTDSTVVVYFNEVPKPIHDAYTSSLVQTCDDASNRVITIYLLVRQKLQRIDNVVTQPQRCCMHFEDVCFVYIGTELYHQYLVGRSPVVLAAMLHTTSCTVSSFCCCRRRALMTPT